jgi:hypothetical protein
MSRQDALNLIRSSDGRIFGVRFVKRSTGELRTMNCRLGVTSHLQGGERSYDPDAKGLVTVFDMHKNGYRSIPVEGIVAVSQGGEWVEVN